ncbi:hypothetical protein ACA910_001934 [Epithemia clementina (nom. ined.)]
MQSSTLNKSTVRRASTLIPYFQDSGKGDISKVFACNSNCLTVIDLPEQLDSIVDELICPKEISQEECSICYPYNLVEFGK